MYPVTSATFKYFWLYRTSRNSWPPLPVVWHNFREGFTKATITRVSLRFFPSLLFFLLFSCFFLFSFPPRGEILSRWRIHAHTHTHTHTHTRVCTREETIGIHQVNIYIHSSPDTVPIKSRTLILSLCPSYIFLLSFFLFFLLSSSPLYLFYTD